MKRRMAIALSAYLITATSLCGQAEQTPEETPDAHAGRAQAAAGQLSPAMEEAARVAWSYLEHNTAESTGLTSATAAYGNLTTWDIGSVLAAVYSAHHLGLIDGAAFDSRIGRVLRMLNTADLFDGAAYNKTYAAASGRMLDRADKESSRGFGWSALDLGRLLIWLNVIAEQHPEHRDAAEAAAARIDFGRTIAAGYMMGSDLDSRGRLRRYVEGRIGYEQYAARGFELWGHPPEHALDVHANADAVEVMGQEILVDRRGENRLTSEPFIMLGLELGFSPEMRRLAEAVLAAQEERYERTGRLTAVSEDAMIEPPYYFYYYSVYLDGREFAVGAQGARQPLDGPRWLSTKAAFGWDALFPGVYTQRILKAVSDGAETSRGWRSGVYEQSLEGAGPQNINTAALVLESVLYRKLGGPLLSTSPD